ncbi:hypothetical protein E4U35_006499 [Claviceps purpurea]|uniref:Hydrophobin n=1 Tax=Claviceps purpurea (strain 20.1) TaxID=1111077 RepID=M1WFJ8_CLAP2|nr:hypothetical protein E4U12_002200 [Claviceps purpurea]CCE33728.1 uncharacterized protein CPUR_07654 [Claviceps purpurea 20.1]KAG6147974.1 hypothetical protein E4U37_007725 [Claviceps purpurea]KAG6167198.1 hypothetical protein E4U11_007420 [Claviceps purpurea]KAG6169840.1 hypothetical protein E4U51_001295 [Claviceps purpurea]
MQLLSAILVAVAASGAVADTPATTQRSTSTDINNEPPRFPRWCNHGTAGNGGCEANGLNTYCCNAVQTPYFEVFRMVTVASENEDGISSCENGGVIWCS